MAEAELRQHLLRSLRWIFFAVGKEGGLQKSNILNGKSWRRVWGEDGTGDPKPTRWVLIRLPGRGGGIIAANYPLGAGRRHVAWGVAAVPIHIDRELFPPLPCGMDTSGADPQRPPSGGRPTRHPTGTRGRDCDRLPAFWGGSLRLPTPDPPHATRGSVPGSLYPADAPTPHPPSPPQTLMGGPRNPLPTPKTTS